MTYLDIYLATLYDALERGGTQDAVDRAVSEINTPTREHFVAWAAGHVVSPRCAVCGEPFKIPDPETIQLTDEVLCKTHTARP